MGWLPDCQGPPGSGCTAQHRHRHQCCTPMPFYNQIGAEFAVALKLSFSQRLFYQDGGTSCDSCVCTLSAERKA